VELHRGEILGIHAWQSVGFEVVEAHGVGSHAGGVAAMQLVRACTAMHMHVCVCLCTSFLVFICAHNFKRVRYTGAD